MKKEKSCIAACKIEKRNRLENSYKRYKTINRLNKAFPISVLSCGPITVHGMQSLYTEKEKYQSEKKKTKDKSNFKF